jgi:peptide/nickel transport system permease protein
VIGYMVRRLLWAVLLLLTMSFLTFVIFFVVPEDRTRVGRGVASVDISLRESFDIESESVPVEYGQFVWNMVRHGTLGESFVDHEPVADVLTRALPVTASLVFGGALLWLLIAIPVGILSALRPRSLIDRTAMVLVLIGISAHPAWLGLMFIYLFGLKLHVAPTGGYCNLLDPNLFCGGPRDWAFHLLLPWVTLACLYAALYVRMIRATVLETLDEDYVRTARAKGAPRWRVLRSHVVRNAALPVVTMLGMDVALAFGGAVFVESVYGLPGVGRTALAALGRRDLPVIMGVVLVVTLVIAVVNLIVDVLYAWLDPRIRVSATSQRVAREDATRAESQPRPAMTGSAS